MLNFLRSLEVGARGVVPSAFFLALEVLFAFPPPSSFSISLSRPEGCSSSRFSTPHRRVLVSRFFSRILVPLPLSSGVGPFGRCAVDIFPTPLRFLKRFTPGAQYRFDRLFFVSAYVLLPCPSSWMPRWGIDRVWHPFLVPQAFFFQVWNWIAESPFYPKVDPPVDPSPFLVYPFWIILAPQEG